MKILFMLSATFMLISCSTLPKHDCTTMNWYRKGKADAVDGKQRKVFSQYRKTCEKFGLKVQKRKYFLGRKKGLRTLCSYEGGIAFGEDGNTYKGTCPSHLEKRFLKGLRIGETAHRLARKEQELAEKEAELQQRESELHDAEMEL